MRMQRQHRDVRCLRQAARRDGRGSRSAISRSHVNGHSLFDGESEMGGTSKISETCPSCFPRTSRTSREIRFTRDVSRFTSPESFHRNSFEATQVHLAGSQQR